MKIIKTKKYNEIMKIIEAASRGGRRRSKHKRKKRRKEIDMNRRECGPSHGGYKYLRNNPLIEEKPDNPSYNPIVPPLKDPVIINKIKQALIDYPEVDIEVLAEMIGVPPEHVWQVSESIDNEE